MADRDKDGIPDNIDIDGGDGTNKASSGTPNQDAQNEAMLAGIAPFLASLLAQDTGKGGPTDTSQSSTQSSVTKLTYNSAKALLEAAMKEAAKVNSGYNPQTKALSRKLKP